jgi:hypothetical protein
MLFFCNVWIQIKIKQMWKAKTEIDGPAGKSIKMHTHYLILEILAYKI